MYKYFLIFFLCTSFTISQGMNFFDSFIEKTSSWFNNSKNNQELWIKTTDNQITCCGKEIINLSTLLTVADQSGLFKNRNNALSTNITTKDLALFIAASRNQTEKFFNSLSIEDHYDLAAIAYALKSPILYAHLLKKILPSDIDHHIADIISPMKKIKSLIIKKILPRTIHLRVEIPLIDNQIMKTECTHDEKFYITTVHGTLLNNDPFNQCIITDIDTKTIIKNINKYDIVQCHPTKNIIALGLTKKLTDLSTLIIYNIDTNTITELEKNENIRQIAFSPNGSYLVATYNAANNISISLWDATDPNKKLSLIGHRENIDTLAFNPQSTCLISGSPEIENSIILWDIKDTYSITQTTLLTNQHSHFKNFIFSKNGDSVLATTTNTFRSFFLPFSDNKSTNSIRLKTPLYALFNAPIIPEKIFYKNERENMVERYNPYTIIAKYGQQDDYLMVKVNQSENRSATYQINHTLHLYILSLKNKEIQRKELDGHYNKLHSLEFNNDTLLLSACPYKTIIWNHKGKELLTIVPKCNTCNAHLSKTGQYLFTIALSKHDGHASVCTEVTELYDATTTQAYNNINQNLSTPQAILLSALYKKSKHDIEYTIKPQSFEALAINSLNKPNECKLIHNTLMIRYSD